MKYKVGDILICRCDLFNFHGEQILEKNKIYKITGTGFGDYYVIGNNYFYSKKEREVIKTLWSSVGVAPSYNMDGYFYTQKEYRRLKLKKINDNVL